MWDKDGDNYVVIPLQPQIPGFAYDINDIGEVVGARIDPAKPKDTTKNFNYAFHYVTSPNPDVPHNLNDLIDPNSGWVLKDARGINNHGEIVGSGFHDGQTRAFLLTPIKNLHTLPTG